MWPVSRLHKIPESSFVRLLLTGPIGQSSKLPPIKMTFISQHGGTSLTGNANFEEEMTRNILVPCTVYVILLPHRLHHLAGQPARNFTPMKSVVRAVAIRHGG